MESRYLCHRSPNRCGVTISGTLLGVVVEHERTNVTSHNPIADAEATWNASTKTFKEDGKAETNRPSIFDFTSGMNMSLYSLAFEHVG